MTRNIFLLSIAAVLLLTGLANAMPKKKPPPPKKQRPRFPKRPPPSPPAPPIVLNFTGQTNFTSWNVTAFSKNEAIEYTSNMGVCGSNSTVECSGEPATRLDAMFNTWTTAFNKTYSEDKLVIAKANFKANIKLCVSINLDRKLKYWTTGNKFSDLNQTGFRRLVLMDKSPDKQYNYTSNNTAVARRLLQTKKAPVNIDWRKRNKVTPIRDQGSCGACWAFATTAALESSYLMQTGANPASVDMSEQQLVSCLAQWGKTINPDWGWFGCAGGPVDLALAYVFNTRGDGSTGQTTEALYPYTSGKNGLDGDCNTGLLKSLKKGQFYHTTTWWEAVPPLSERALMEAVALGPVPFFFMVDASFMQYDGGVYTPSTCTNEINHAMTIVGYNTTSSEGKHWIIRNSWGPDWGEAGYARVAMTGDGEGACGMYQVAFIPARAFDGVLQR